MAVLSAADKVEAFAPPVPVLAMAAMASAGMVSWLGAVTVARTSAMLVVLRTEALAEAKRDRRRTEAYDFMVADAWSVSR